MAVSLSSASVTLHLLHFIDPDMGKGDLLFVQQNVAKVRLSSPHVCLILAPLQPVNRY
jgi:hypothetical protein